VKKIIITLLIVFISGGVAERAYSKTKRKLTFKEKIQRRENALNKIKKTMKNFPEDYFIQDKSHILDEKTVIDVDKNIGEMGVVLSFHINKNYDKIINNIRKFRFKKSKNIIILEVREPFGKERYIMFTKKKHARFYFNGVIKDFYGKTIKKSCEKSKKVERCQKKRRKVTRMEVSDDIFNFFIAESEKLKKITRYLLVYDSDGKELFKKAIQGSSFVRYDNGHIVLLNISKAKIGEVIYIKTTLDIIDKAKTAKIIYE
jgi:hypothetical protein